MNVRHAIGHVALAAVLGGGGFACASAQTSQSTQPELPSAWAEAREVAVHITNENYTDVTVYSIRNQDRASVTRVGYVPGFGSRDFTFSWSDGELAFLIEFLALGSVATQNLAVNPGDTLNLVVTPDLHRRASR